MSFAKDDIGLTNAQAVTQASIIKTRIVKDSSEIEATTTEDLEKQEKLTFSENIDKRLSEDKNSLDQSQEDSTKLDIINNSYTAISDAISEIKKQVDSAVDSDLTEEDLSELNDSIKSKLGNIEEIVKNTTFGGEKLLNTSSSSASQEVEEDSNTDESVQAGTSLKALGLPAVDDIAVNNKEDAEALAESLDSADQEVIKRQDDASNSQVEIQKNLNDLFLTKINLLENEGSSTGSVEETKSNVISGILDEPSKSVKVQIDSIDPDVLIALVRLNA